MCVCVYKCVCLCWEWFFFEKEKSNFVELNAFIERISKSNGIERSAIQRIHLSLNSNFHQNELPLWLNDVSLFLIHFYFVKTIKWYFLSTNGCCCSYFMLFNSQADLIIMIASDCFFRAVHGHIRENDTGVYGSLLKNKNWLLNLFLTDFYLSEDESNTDIIRKPSNTK